MKERPEPQIEWLLQKYAGGRMPPLVDVTTPESGLINGELLQIYHSGLRSKHSVALGVLLAASHYTSLEEKWQTGSFELDNWSKPWPLFCQALRDTKMGYEIYEQDSRCQAIIAEKEGDVIAYLSDSGMIDFAMPISVKDRIIAVLLGGQVKPKRGPIWNPEIIQSGGLFRPLGPGETGVDAWMESQQRFEIVAQRTGLSEDIFLGNLPEDTNPATEFSPQKVSETQELLRRASSQLSDLATSTYELEKGKVIDWIKNQIARSLAPLSSTLEDASKVWRRLSASLEYMIKYFEVDYALIFSWRDEREDEIEILCNAGLVGAKFSIGKRFHVAS